MERIARSLGHLAGMDVLRDGMRSIRLQMDSERKQPMPGWFQVESVHVGPKPGWGRPRSCGTPSGSLLCDPADIRRRADFLPIVPLFIFTRTGSVRAIDSATGAVEGFVARGTFPTGSFKMRMPSQEIDERSG